MDDTNEELLTEIRELATSELAQGFSTDQELTDYVLEAVADESDLTLEELTPLVKQVTSRLISEHVQLEKTWPTLTDCDKLDLAFDTLNKAGIVARQHFSCCGTCGSGEISDLMFELSEKSENIRGYTFYHIQGTEAAANQGGLYLSYGAFDGTTKEAVVIGHEIVATIRKAGLNVEWDGTIGHCIYVELDWKRRRKCTKA